MFCRNCGAELPNDSSFCPKCGKSVAEKLNHDITAVSAGAPMESTALAAPRKSRKRLYLGLSIGLASLVLLTLIVFIAFWVYTAIWENNVPQNGVYNHELGITLRLGQDKAEIDKLLGEPQITAMGYEYEDAGNVVIDYTDKKAALFFIGQKSNGWVAYKGVSSNSTQKDIIHKLGEPSTNDISSDCYYYKATGENAPQDGDGMFYDVDYYLQIIKFDDGRISVGIINAGYRL